MFCEVVWIAVQVRKKKGKKRDRLMLGKQLAQFGLAATNAKGLEKKA